MSIPEDVSADGRIYGAVKNGRQGELGGSLKHLERIPGDCESEWHSLRHARAHTCARARARWGLHTQTHTQLHTQLHTQAHTQRDTRGETHAEGGTGCVTLTPIGWPLRGGKPRWIDRRIWSRGILMHRLIFSRSPWKILCNSEILSWGILPAFFHHWRRQS